jgi:hypothetical protein
MRANRGAVPALLLDMFPCRSLIGKLRKKLEGGDCGFAHGFKVSANNQVVKYIIPIINN